MLIDTRYRIWKAAAHPTDPRPVLSHVWITRIDETHGLAMAADGYILAVVPVELDPADVPGPVRLEILRRAARIPEWRDGLDHYAGLSNLALGAETVTLNDQTIMQRKTIADDAVFPDIYKIVPLVPEPDGPRGTYIGLNPTLLRRAIRAAGIGAVRMLVTAIDQPLLLTKLDVEPTPGALPVPPYAILMPVLAKNEYEIWEAAKRAESSAWPAAVLP